MTKKKDPCKCASKYCAHYKSDFDRYCDNHRPKKVCPCGKHSLKEYQMMKEAKASSELEEAKTDKTICQLLDTL